MLLLLMRMKYWHYWGNMNKNLYLYRGPARSLHLNLRKPAFWGEKTNPASTEIEVRVAPAPENI